MAAGQYYLIDEKIRLLLMDDTIDWDDPIDNELQCTKALTFLKVLRDEEAPVGLKENIKVLDINLDDHDYGTIIYVFINNNGIMQGMSEDSEMRRKSKVIYEG
jgi:hypothetical protein